MTIKVTATDPDGQTSSISPPVVVAPLQAVAVANPQAVALGGTILFTVTPTTGAIIDHYVWDFGDGEPPLSRARATRSRHVYLTKRGHTATITVFPAGGTGARPVGADRHQLIRVLGYWALELLGYWETNVLP